MAEDAQGELKQQGAIETAHQAAQDPQVDVQPEAVEKALLDETKKAGVPAFQFDPNAPPEEKAAAAQSVGRSALTWCLY